MSKKNEIGTRPISNSLQKIVEKLEKKALLPGQNNCSFYGMTDCLPTKKAGDSCEVNRPLDSEADEDENLVVRNSKSHGVTAYSHQKFEENGFGIISENDLSHRGRENWRV
ncbi:MAG: hypothetical protein Athens071416_560 [Parcubacteria group bacterium Athens0714_16]|nr:MAG: hypothetical protein Athens071416_560 [Parcubacteria group bacterium Athens0714_16]